ncbi:MAG: hypothetical protein ABH885_07750, partial [Candidatus Omnitrophota bacterium]
MAEHAPARSLSSLSAWTATERPFMNRRVLVTLYRENLMWCANNTRYLAMLDPRYGIGLLDTNGKYLVRDEALVNSGTEKGSIDLIRSILLFEFDVLLSREREENNPGFQAVTAGISRNAGIVKSYCELAGIDYSGEIPDDGLVHDLLVKAFEIHTIIEKKVVDSREHLTAAEAGFHDSIRGILEELDETGGHKNFPECFYNVQKRLREVRRIKGVTANVPLSPGAKTAEGPVVTAPLPVNVPEAVTEHEEDSPNDGGSPTHVRKRRAAPAILFIPGAFSWTDLFITVFICLTIALIIRWISAKSRFRIPEWLSGTFSMPRFIPFAAMVTASSTMRKLDAIHTADHLISVGGPDKVSDALRKLRNITHDLGRGRIAGVLDNMDFLNETPANRQIIIDTLRKMGRPALEDLDYSLKGKDFSRRLIAIEAMAGLGTKAAVEHMCRMLGNKPSGHRDGCVVVVNKLSRMGRPGIEALVERLDHERHSVRMAIADALGRTRDPMARFYSELFYDTGLSHKKYHPKNFEFLIKALYSGPEVATAALRVFQKTRDRRAVKPLNDAIAARINADSYTYFVSNARDTLINIVTDNLHDPDFAIRAIAPLYRIEHVLTADEGVNEGLVTQAATNFRKIADMLLRRSLPDSVSLALPSMKKLRTYINVDDIKYAGIEDVLKSAQAAPEDVVAQGFMQTGTDTRPVPTDYYASTYFIELRDGRFIYIKYGKAARYSSRESLGLMNSYRGAYLMDRLKGKGCENLPRPLLRDKGYLFKLNPHELPTEIKPNGINRYQVAIAFIDEKNTYYDYVNDQSQSLNGFSKNFLARVKELASLAGKGIIHDALIPRYHTTEGSGKPYEWRADPMGMFCDWLDACESPNLGRDTIRDLEHILLYSKIKTEDQLDHVGDHLLQLTMVLGSYFRNKIDYGRKKGLKGRIKTFKGFTPLLRKTFLSYYKEFTGRDPAVLDKCIDWDDLGEKLAWHMIKDRYKNEAVGEIFVKGDLGDTNGAFPVQELARAIHITSMACVIAKNAPKARWTRAKRGRSSFLAAFMMAPGFSDNFGGFSWILSALLIAGFAYIAIAAIIYHISAKSRFRIPEWLSGTFSMPRLIPFAAMVMADTIPRAVRAKRTTPPSNGCNSIKPIPAPINAKGHFMVGLRRFKLKKHGDILYNGLPVEVIKFPKGPETRQIGSFKVRALDGSVSYPIDLDEDQCPVGVPRKRAYDIYDVLKERGQLPGEKAVLEKAAEEGDDAITLHNVTYSGLKDYSRRIALRGIDENAPLTFRREYLKGSDRGFWEFTCIYAREGDGLRLVNRIRLDEKGRPVDVRSGADNSYDINNILYAQWEPLPIPVSGNLLELNDSTTVDVSTYLAWLAQKKSAPAGVKAIKQVAADGRKCLQLWDAGKDMDSGRALAQLDMLEDGSIIAGQTKNGDTVDFLEGLIAQGKAAAFDTEETVWRHGQADTARIGKVFFAKINPYFNYLRRLGIKGLSGLRFRLEEKAIAIFPVYADNDAGKAAHAAPATPLHRINLDENGYITGYDNAYRAHILTALEKQGNPIVIFHDKYGGAHAYGINYTFNKYAQNTSTDMSKVRVTKLLHADGTAEIQVRKTAPGTAMGEVLDSINLDRDKRPVDFKLGRKGTSASFWAVCVAQGKKVPERIYAGDTDIVIINNVHYTGVDKYFRYWKRRGLKTLERMKFRILKDRIEIIGLLADEKEAPLDRIILDENGFPKDVPMNEEAEANCTALQKALALQGNPEELFIVTIKRPDRPDIYYVKTAGMNCEMQSFFDFKGITHHDVKVIRYTGTDPNPRIEIRRKADDLAFASGELLAALNIDKDGRPIGLKGNRALFRLLKMLVKQGQIPRKAYLAWLPKNQAPERFPEGDIDAIEKAKEDRISKFGINANNYRELRRLKSEGGDMVLLAACIREGIPVQGRREASEAELSQIPEPTPIAEFMFRNDPVPLQEDDAARLFTEALHFDEEAIAELSERVLVPAAIRATAAVLQVPVDSMSYHSSLTNYIIQETWIGLQERFIDWDMQRPFFEFVDGLALELARSANRSYYAREGISEFNGTSKRTAGSIEDLGFITGVQQPDVVEPESARTLEDIVEEYGFEIPADTIREPAKRGLALDLRDFIMKTDLPRLLALEGLHQFSIIIIGSMGHLGIARPGCDINLMLLADVPFKKLKKALEIFAYIIGGEYRSRNPESDITLVMGKDGSYHWDIQQSKGFIKVLRRHGIGSEESGFATLEVVSSEDIPDTDFTTPFDRAVYQSAGVIFDSTAIGSLSPNARPVFESEPGIHRGQVMEMRRALKLDPDTFTQGAVSYLKSIISRQLRKLRPADLYGTMLGLAFLPGFEGFDLSSMFIVAGFTAIAYIVIAALIHYVNTKSRVKGHVPEWLILPLLLVYMTTAGTGPSRSPGTAGMFFTGRGSLPQTKPRNLKISYGRFTSNNGVRYSIRKHHDILTDGGRLRVVAHKKRNRTERFEVYVKGRSGTGRKIGDIRIKPDGSPVGLKGKKRLNYQLYDVLRELGQLPKEKAVLEKEAKPGARHVSLLGITYTGLADYRRRLGLRGFPESAPLIFRRALLRRSDSKYREYTAVYAKIGRKEVEVNRIELDKEGWPLSLAVTQDKTCVITDALSAQWQNLAVPVTGTSFTHSDGNEIDVASYMVVQAARGNRHDSFKVLRRIGNHPKAPCIQIWDGNSDMLTGRPIGQLDLRDDGSVKGLKRGKRKQALDFLECMVLQGKEDAGDIKEVSWFPGGKEDRVTQIGRTRFYWNGTYLDYLKRILGIQNIRGLRFTRRGEYIEIRPIPRDRGKKDAAKLLHKLRIDKNGFLVNGNGSRKITVLDALEKQGEPISQYITPKEGFVNINQTTYPMREYLRRMELEESDIRVTRQKRDDGVYELQVRKAATGTAMGEVIDFIELNEYGMPSGFNQTGGKLSVSYWRALEVQGKASLDRNPIVKLLDDATATVIINNFFYTSIPPYLRYLRSRGYKDAKYIKFTIKNRSVELTAVLAPEGGKEREVYLGTVPLNENGYPDGIKINEETKADCASLSSIFQQLGYPEELFVTERLAQQKYKTHQFHTAEMEIGMDAYLKRLNLKPSQVRVVRYLGNKSPRRIEIRRKTRSMALDSGECLCALELDEYGHPIDIEKRSGRCDLLGLLIELGRIEYKRPYRERRLRPWQDGFNLSGSVYTDLKRYSAYVSTLVDGDITVVIAKEAKDSIHIMARVKTENGITEKLLHEISVDPDTRRPHLMPEGQKGIALLTILELQGRIDAVSYKAWRNKRLQRFPEGDSSTIETACAGRLEKFGPDANTVWGLNRDMIEGGDRTLLYALKREGRKVPRGPKPPSKTMTRFPEGDTESIEEALAGRLSEYGPAANKAGKLRLPVRDGGDPRLLAACRREGIVLEGDEDAPDITPVMEFMYRAGGITPDEKEARALFRRMSGRNGTAAAEFSEKICVPMTVRAVEGALHRPLDQVFDQDLADYMVQEVWIKLLEKVRVWSADSGQPLLGFAADIARELAREAKKDYDTFVTEDRHRAYSLQDKVTTSGNKGRDGEPADKTLFEGRPDELRQEWEVVDEPSEMLRAAVEEIAAKDGKDIIFEEEKQELISELREFLLSKGLPETLRRHGIGRFCLLVVGGLGHVGIGRRGGDINMMFISDAPEENIRSALEEFHRVIGGEYFSGLDKRLPQIRLGKDGSYHAAIAGGNGFYDILMKYGIGSPEKGLASLVPVSSKGITLHEPGEDPDGETDLHAFNCETFAELSGNARVVIESSPAVRDKLILQLRKAMGFNDKHETVALIKAHLGILILRQLAKIGIRVPAAESGTITAGLKDKLGTSAPAVMLVRDKVTGRWRQWTEGRKEAYRLTSAHHRLINETWGWYWEAYVMPESRHKLDMRDGIYKDVYEAIKPFNPDFKPVHIHSPPDGKFSHDEFYAKLYEFAARDNVVFPPRDDFRIMTHAGTYRSGRGPRSFNLLIPKTMRDFLEYLRDEHPAVYKRWLDHEIYHLRDRSNKGRSDIPFREGWVTWRRPVKRIAELYNRYAGTGNTEFLTDNMAHLKKHNGFDQDELW